MSAVSCHTCCQHQCSNQNESLNFCWHFQLATKTPTVCSKRMLGSAAKPLRVLTLYPSAYSRTIKKHQSSTSLSNKLSCRIKHGWLFFYSPPKRQRTACWMPFEIKGCSSCLWVKHFCCVYTRLICTAPRCCRCSRFCVLLMLGGEGGIVADPGTFLF